LRSIGFIACGLEEIVAFLIGEKITDVTDGAPEVIVGPRGGPSDKSVELGKGRNRPIGTACLIFGRWVKTRA